MQIRPANYADRSVILDLLLPVFRAGETYAIDPEISEEEALAYWFSGAVYLAEENLGTFYIHPNRQGGGAHYCNCGFITSPKAQGKGVARAMLDHALGEAVRLGYLGMVFNFVLADNFRAVVTWEKAGFEIVGRVPRSFRHKDGREVDSLVMFRDLRRNEM